MLITDTFELDLNQEDLDFVNVDTGFDSKLYIDPSRIHLSEGKWFQECSEVIINFFDYVLSLYSENRVNEAEDLFDYAHEPNETCLGQSRSQPGGRGSSPDKLKSIFDEMHKAGMVRDGLIKKPMDLCVFVEDFAEDRMSDLVTNLIRGQLAKYTVDQCNSLGIPLTSDKRELGMTWDLHSQTWAPVISEALTIDDRVILLVPKEIIVKKYLYSVDKYLSKYVLEQRQKEHLEQDTSLVRSRYSSTLNKMIKIKPKKATLKEKEISDEGLTYKEYARNITRDRLDLIERFRTEIYRSLSILNSNKLSDEEIEAVVKREDTVIER